MTATINGVAWKAASPSFTNISGALVIAGGTSIGHQVITLQAPANSVIGTAYQMNNTSYAATYNTTISSIYGDTTGVITITALTATTVSGTFNFNAKNTSNDSIAIVSNGKFYVSVL